MCNEADNSSHQFISLYISITQQEDDSSCLKAHTGMRMSNGVDGSYRADDIRMYR